MSDERKRCPRCGYVSPFEATDSEREAGKLCSPLRCSAWKVVEKATAPHPVTGARTMLRLIDPPDEPGGQR